MFRFMIVIFRRRFGGCGRSWAWRTGRAMMMSRRGSRLAARSTVTARVLSVLGATMRSRGALACLESRGTWRSLGCTCCEELNVCNNKLEYLYILYIILKISFSFLVLMLAILLFFNRF